MVERKARHNNSVAIYPGKRIQVVLYNKLPFLHIFCWYFLSYSVLVNWIHIFFFCWWFFNWFFFFYYKLIIERRFFGSIYFCSERKRGRWNE